MVILSLKRFLFACAVILIKLLELRCDVGLNLNTTSENAKIIFMMPKNESGDYTLNERNSLNSKLTHGWVFKSDTEIDLLLYLIVDQPVSSLDEIQNGFVYFTQDPKECIVPHDYLVYNELTKNDHKSRNFLFRLNFLANKSSIESLNPKRIRKQKFLQNSDTKSIKNNGTNFLVAELTINLKHNSLKYYSCVHFSRKTALDTTTKTNKDLTFVHQGESFLWTQIITTTELLPIYIVVIFYFVLLMFSALFSGLNLGLMSLDLTELTILKKIGSKHEKEYAKKIYPLRKRGNLLLCTILLGNVLVNSTSTLILGSYLEGIAAAAGSTILIVIFGEIIPQAACSRHGLAVGAYTRFITYFMMGLTFIVSFPLSKVLDKVLGKEIAIQFSRDKVRELMRQAKDGKNIEEEQYKLISGALDFKNKKVNDAMVPIKDVFSLDINSVLDFDTFKSILHNGYSRIPVFEFTKYSFFS